MTERCQTTFYPNGAYCVDCDEQPFIQEVPAHVDTIIVRAWDTGANSAATREAPCYLSWSPSAHTVGEMLGLYSQPVIRTDVTNPGNIAAAFYVYTLGVTMFAEPRAFGASVGSAFGVTPSTVLRIEHVGNRATFKVDGATIATCAMPEGANRAGIAMYQSGDEVARPTFAALTVYDAIGTASITGTGSIIGFRSANFARLVGRGSIVAPRQNEGRLIGRGSIQAAEQVGFGVLYGAGGIVAFGNIAPPNANYAEIHGSGSLLIDAFIADYGDAGVYGSGSLLGFEQANWASFTGTGSIQASEHATPLGAVILLLESPGGILLTAGYVRERMRDTLAVAATPVQQLINTLIERLQLIAQPTTALQTVMLLREAVDFVDQIGVIWKLLLQDTVAVAGVTAPSLVAMQQVVEILSLIAGPGSAVSVTNLIAETLALNDVLAVVARESIGETAAFNAALTTALQARNRLLDQLLVAAVPSGSARILAVIDETIDFGATSATALEALSRIQETIGFSLTLTIGDDTYVAWVVNTETRAAWQYENWPFNSYCEFEGTYLGAMDDGVYTLGGDDDGGDDIKARFRIGMSNMGIAREKRIPSLYMAYAATGKLVVKAITTEIDGTRSEYWYQLTPRGTGGVREGRVQIGRGLKAYLWDFEIANVAGADFDIDSLQFCPMVLDRKVRGRDG